MYLPLAFDLPAFTLSLLAGKYGIKLVKGGRRVELEARRQVGPWNSIRYERLGLSVSGFPAAGSFLRDE